MPRDYKVYLDDITEAAGKITRYTAGFTLETLADDEKTVDAVIRNLEIIGEAVKISRTKFASSISKSNGKRLLVCETF